MSSVQESESTDTSSTICPSSISPSLENRDEEILPLSFTFCKVAVSEKSSSTRFVQYINNAAYIERPYDESISALEEPDDFDSKTFPCVDDRDRDEFSPFSGSTTKMQLCKVVEDSEVVRLRKKSYAQWLENKREQENKRAEEKRKKEMKINSELEAKRKKSQEKVQEWMKKHPRDLKESENRKPKNNDKFQQVPKKQLKSSKYEEWVKKKQEQEKAEQERRKEERRAIQQYADYRQSLANAFYKKWADGSKEKPKPVPFNHGFASLASCTASPYFNPIPWEA